MGSRLEGKVAVVTGSATGIGKAIARLFATEGASVVIADISESTASHVVSEICKDGGNAVFLRTDVSVASDVRNLMERAFSTYGKLDVLVNNAAAYFGDGGILALSDEIWNKVIDVNLKGTYLCCKYALPKMIESGRGSIINMSSVNALFGLSLTAYTASKGGISALTRLLAIDFGLQGVRTNAICPGTIMTENTASVYAKRPGLEDQVTKMYPVGRLGTPEEVAECALYLASDASTFVNGATLLIDGGLSAGRRFQLDYTTNDG